MKFFLKIFLFSFLFFFCLQTFSYGERVQDVFVDIDKNYEYLDELQTLYDKGAIKPDKNGKFNPRELLSRDEFVGIMSEVSCQSCTKPRVDPIFVKKYQGLQSYFDVFPTNRYSYCIEHAQAEGNISGYDEGEKCENGVSEIGKRPFCPANTIILEEALAILLRAGNILSKQGAEARRTELQTKSSVSLSDDVVSKLPDGSVYSFYPDFEKALNYKVEEYDLDGNLTTYSLIEKKDNKLRPKKAISKEEFLKIAFVALKENACPQSFRSSFALEIDIFPKTCRLENVESCREATLVGYEQVFDFRSNIGDNKNIDIKNPDNFLWRFYNYDTGEEILRKGYYIDNYDFFKSGRYRVTNTVYDNFGDSAEAYSELNILSSLDRNTKKNNNLKLSITASDLTPAPGVMVDFRSIISSPLPIASYRWEFGDGSISKGKNPSHSFTSPGIYDVRLKVTTKNGESIEAKLVIHVGEKTDSDEDGVIDAKDYEVDTPSDKINYICTKSDIEASKYNCQTEDLGVYKPEKEGQILLDSEDNFGLKIDVYDQECSQSVIGQCVFSRLDGEKTVFDLYSNIGANIHVDRDNPANFRWKFVNKNTRDTVKRTGIYIDNYDFLTPGFYRVHNTVTDNNGNISSAFVDISIRDKSNQNSDNGDNLKVSIQVSNLFPNPGENVDFESIVSSPMGVTGYSWDFGDGTQGSGIKPSHTYNSPGTYTVTLTVRSIDGSERSSQIVIEVGTQNDSDGDGVPDTEDREVNTPADKINTICTKKDIREEKRGCKIQDLGVGQDTDLTPDFGAQIHVYTKDCSNEKRGACNSFSYTDKDETVFDFYGDIGDYMGVDFDNSESFQWKFISQTTGNTTIKKGQYIDNHDFLSSGKYRVELLVTDTQGNTSEAFVTLYISLSNEGKKPDLQVSIYATDLFPFADEKVRFSAITFSSEDIKKYEWDFGDGTIGAGKNSIHSFEKVGVYKVKLQVTDVKNNVADSFVSIQVRSKIDSDNDGVTDDEDKEVNTPPNKIDTICTKEDIREQRRDCNPEDLGVAQDEEKTKDSDDDGIPDSEDICPELSGAKQNNGCPILVDSCKETSDCGAAEYCENGFCSPKKFKTGCYYDGGALIFGNVECSSCPCDYSFDFNAKIKKCDIIFPAITSPDETNLYSKGNYFRIKK